MKWSTRIGQFAGIGVYIHWTFWLLIGWIFYSHLSQGDELAVALEGVGFIAAIFACVVLHEFGHALTAKHYGIKTRDITLLPIGGVARLERIPEDPRQELWVAVAGPAVNVVIAGILFVVVLTMYGFQAAADVQLVGGDFLAKLMFVNIALVVFNMIPAFPMDGGRVLRALLARNMSYVRATQTAAHVGQLIAIGFGIVGVFTNWFLLFIAIFVYLGAQQEAHGAQMRAVMKGVPVREAMITRFRVLEDDDNLEQASRELLAGDQHDFPVVKGGRFVGLLTRNDLLAAIANGQLAHPVKEFMRRDCRGVEDTAMLDETFSAMREDTCPSVPVLRNGEIVGVINLENVGEWMMIQSAALETRARGDVDDVFSSGDGQPK
jgi:Zn-dependent protease/CBS domain-containing protein